MELFVAFFYFTLLSIIAIIMFRIIGLFFVVPALAILFFVVPTIFVGCPPNSYVFNEDTGFTTYNHYQLKFPWEHASTMPKSLDSIYDKIHIQTTSKSGINYKILFSFKNLEFTNQGIRHFNITSQKQFEDLMRDQVIKPAVQPIIDNWSPDYAHYTGVKNPKVVGQAIWKYLQASPYKMLFIQSPNVTPHDLQFGYYTIGMSAYELDDQYPSYIEGAESPQPYSTLDGDGDGYYDPFEYTHYMLPGQEK